MHTFISMLRGINVSGQKKIIMADLRKLYESLGLVKVKSYVQSGNVIFDSQEPDASKLATLLETQIEQTYGYTVSVFMRDSHDFQRIINSNLFTNERDEDPTKLYVTFLYTPLAKSKLHNPDIPPHKADEFIIGATEIFLFCPHGYGRTKYSNNFFERKLKVTATSRNWKTINALYKMVQENV